MYPAGHTAQLVGPAPEELLLNFPASHTEHDADPATPLNVPASHTVHAAVPPPLADPGTHCVHVFAVES